MRATRFATMQAMLKRAGCQVSTAGDGAKALAALEAGVAAGAPPHIVLCDVMMPGLSGYDVVRRIREDYPSLLLPVILVSASGREEQVVQGLEAGADDYLTKPFGARELLARVQAQLRTKAYAEAAVVAAAAGAPPA
jgi:DNA-binding response OmpR family regulator